MGKWTASVALLCLGLGLGACREPLPPPSTNTVRKDAGVERPRPMPDTGSSPEPDAPSAPPPEAGSDADVDGPDGAIDARADVGGDRGADRVSDGPGADRGPAAGNCGLARPDLTMVVGTMSVAVARDGTLYFAHAMGNDGYIGRLRPSGPAAMALTARLVRIPSGSRLTGMAIDRGRNVLYVASASGRAVHTINLQANPPTVRELVIGVPSPSDLVWSSDGNLYYGEQSDRRIYKLTPTGVRTQMTPTPLSDGGTMVTPAALTFGPAGELYVGSAAPGPIMRLTLAAGVEQGRARFGMYDGVADGLAFDGAGRLYVVVHAATGQSRVLRLDAAGWNPTEVATGSQLSSLTFGQGGLDCHDLYVTSRPGAMLRLSVDIPGAQ